jgi:hypothetical protein
MLPEMIGYFAFSIVAAAALARATAPLEITAFSAGLSLALVNFALCLYPAFQLPLAYLGAALLGGLAAPGLLRGPSRARGLRLLGAAAALLFAAVVVGSFVADAKDTIDLARNTVYPGERVAAGGDVAWTRIFGGLYGFFQSEERYPAAWDNVCEASAFLLLFPVPLAHLVFRLGTRRTVAAVEWGLLGYVVLVVTWMWLGWLPSLASITGLRHVPAVRAASGLGLASILWCCVFLSRREDPDDTPATRTKLVWAGAFGALALLFAAWFDRSIPGFLEPRDVVLGCAIAAAGAYTLVGRHVLAFAATVCVPGFLAFGLVNPVAVGLSPILENGLCRKVSALVERDPSARWTVYGDALDADLLKTTGAHVFNGTLVVPPFDDLAVLDPGGGARHVYNRYAHVRLDPVQDPRIAFVPGTSGDRYAISIDPKSVAWRRLGIRYAVLPYRSTDPGFLAVAELVETIPEDRLGIYRYRW